MEINGALTIISGLFSFSTIIFVVYSLISNEIRKKLIFSKVSNFIRYNILVLFIPFVELSIILFYIYFEVLILKSNFINPINFFILFLLFTVSIIVQTYFILEPISKSDIFQEKLIDIDIKFLKNQIELLTFDKKETLILRFIDILIRTQLNQHTDHSNFWFLSEQSFSNYFGKILDIDVTVKNSYTFLKSLNITLAKFDIPFNLREYDVDRVVLLKVELGFINNDRIRFRAAISNFSIILNVYKSELNNSDFNEIINLIVEVLLRNNDFTQDLDSFSTSSVRSAVDAYLIFKINKVIRHLITEDSLNNETKEAFHIYLQKFEHGGYIYNSNPRFVKMVKDLEGDSNV